MSDWDDTLDEALREHVESGKVERFTDAAGVVRFRLTAKGREAAEALMKSLDQ